MDGQTVNRVFLKLSIFLVLLVSINQQTLACSTCLVDPNSNTASALNGAILLLLALIAGIFLIMAGCLWKLSRRIKAMENRGEIL